MVEPERSKDCLRGFVYLDKKRHVNYQGGNNTKHQANGVLGLVFGVITTLVVDMAFLIQVNKPP